jgi:hypothetical protein
MEQIIDIAIRALLTVNTTPDDTKCMIETTKEHATSLLQLLEASVGSSVFIGHYSTIQRRIENSKNEKRRKIAAEAIIEPKVYAERKVIDFTYCIHDVEKLISVINDYHDCNHDHCHQHNHHDDNRHHDSIYNMDPIV